MNSKEMSNSEHKAVQALLLNLFKDPTSTSDLNSTAQAGLCLRCYISESILKACHKLDYLFKGQGRFTYRDLLPFVLNDDAQRDIVLDQNSQQQLLRNGADQLLPATYEIFSVKVLQSFDADSQASMSLENWAYLQTKQNSEIKKFLSEFGFQQLSDWALLNRIKKVQLEQLTSQDQHLIMAFHAVYRNDRRAAPRQKTKCPVPSASQLERMVAHLQQNGIVTNTPSTLLGELKRIASQLRHYDCWASHEPLEIYDPESKSYTSRYDLPDPRSNSTALEQEELLTFLNHTLLSTMTDAMDQVLSQQLQTLSKSRRYATYVNSLIPGLLLYYRDGLPLRAVAAQLDMSSWDQARRILNPGQLLRQVRTLTISKFLEQTLQKVRQLGLIQNAPSPDYLDTLIARVETFADAEIFTKAAEEIRAGKNRTLESLYAQQLIQTLETATQTRSLSLLPSPSH